MWYTSGFGSRGTYFSDIALSCCTPKDLGPGAVTLKTDE